MLRYLLRRLVVFIPTLLVISLLAFGLSKVAPGDPVEDKSEAATRVSDPERVYRETATFWGLDKPVFYFSLTSAAYPDSLYKIVLKYRRETLQKLIAQYGNWPQIDAYYQQIQALEATLYTLPYGHAVQEAGLVRSTVRDLYLHHRDARISVILDTLQALAARDSALMRVAGTQINTLQQQYVQVKSTATLSKLLQPDFKWHGLDNQYHNWFSRFLRGDFGRSYYDSRPVAHKMKDALFWTLVMNGTAILLAYILSIPIGVFSAVRRNTPTDRVLTVLLFVLYSLPTFWIATMLVVFFTTPQYGMDWFPTMGVGNVPDSASLWQLLSTRIEHLALPVFCLTYGSLAFISRQMRGGMLDVLQQDYVRTARAKGLPHRTVIWKHAFRNALFPLVTMFASVFPAMLAGSVVIEVIFNIPGMGKLTIDAINARDWPVVYTVLMLSAILTMVGILISDMLYAALDPRVSYRRRQA